MLFTEGLTLTREHHTSYSWAEKWHEIFSNGYSTELSCI